MFAAMDDDAFFERQPVRAMEDYEEIMEESFEGIYSVFVRLF